MILLAKLLLERFADLAAFPSLLFHILDGLVNRYLSQIENRVKAMSTLTEELFRYSVITSAGELRPERLDMVQEHIPSQ